MALNESNWSIPTLSLPDWRPSAGLHPAVGRFGAEVAGASTKVVAILELTFRLQKGSPIPLIETHSVLGRSPLQKRRYTRSNCLRKRLALPLSVGHSRSPRARAKHSICMTAVKVPQYSEAHYRHSRLSRAEPAPPWSPAPSSFSTETALSPSSTDTYPSGERPPRRSVADLFPGRQAELLALATRGDGELEFQYDDDALDS